MPISICFSFQSHSVLAIRFPVFERFTQGNRSTLKFRRESGREVYSEERIQDQPAVIWEILPPPQKSIPWAYKNTYPFGENSLVEIVTKSLVELKPSDAVTTDLITFTVCEWLYMLNASVFRFCYFLPMWWWTNRFPLIGLRFLHSEKDNSSGILFCLGKMGFPISRKLQQEGK